MLYEIFEPETAIFFNDPLATVMLLASMISILREALLGTAPRTSRLVLTTHGAL
jgi:hypothetical protein